MRPVRIAGAEERPLGAPLDWDAEKHGTCGGLFIRRESKGGMAYMRSAWEVESGEAITFLAGAKLTLGIQGVDHPVVQLGIDFIPEDFEPVLAARRFTAGDGRPMARVEMMFAKANGQRIFANVHVDGTFADAVSMGIIQIENFARQEGWL